MADDIVNRVANSKLVTFDLEDYYPTGERVLLDISNWLYEGIVLREKEFRAYVLSHNWSQYQNQYVAVNCSTDAIIPAWAYMLISVELQPFSKLTVVGNLEALETVVYQDIIDNLDISDLKDKPIIIKGCSKKPVPLNAYSMISSKLKPVAKSIMFGEACSNVPLFKRK
ncbi:DUF2480 family protein [Hanstruepera ponticola]|uniref:DUF2480 family protein n=1 Tax=Hanstruepera ponticola TaxID=2042995 RepID=UPI001786B3AE|nr:DUF2480 family protein [Hanstruepera ponticola]